MQGKEKRVYKSRTLQMITYQFLLKARSITNSNGTDEIRCSYLSGVFHYFGARA